MSEKPARLPWTWKWLGDGKVPPNYARCEAHPEYAHWAVSYNARTDGEFAVCVESRRTAGRHSVYGPSWRSMSEAVSAGWIARGADTPATKGES